MMSSYELELCGRAYREDRLAEAAQARLAAAIPRTQEKGGSTMVVALRYVRYALTSLASVAFLAGTN
jgi:hypothetical protein